MTYLENTFKTVYVWFAIRGKALPAPAEKMVGVIVGDSTEYRRYRDTFEASNLVADGFHARRENLAVFSARRLDKASINFEQLTKDVYRQSRVEDLFKARDVKDLPNPKQNPQAPATFQEYARASTIALVDAALQEEAEMASASHEGTRQIFGETGLVPRNVLAPEWVRFGSPPCSSRPRARSRPRGRPSRWPCTRAGAAPTGRTCVLRGDARRQGADRPERGPTCSWTRSWTCRSPAPARPSTLEKALSKKAEEGDSKAVKSGGAVQPGPDPVLVAGVLPGQGPVPRVHRSSWANSASCRGTPTWAGRRWSGRSAGPTGWAAAAWAGPGSTSSGSSRSAASGITFMAQQQSPSRKLKLDDLQVRGPSGGHGVGGPRASRAGAGLSRRAASRLPRGRRPARAAPGGGGAGYPGGGTPPGYPPGGGGHRRPVRLPGRPGRLIDRP